MLNDTDNRLHSASQGSRLGSSRASPRILLIQDHEALRDTLTAILQLEGGYDVVSTGDGPRGLQTFLREQPDLVIVDIELSGRFGMRIVGELKERSPDVPVILLTQDLAQVSSAMPSVAVVRKPFQSSWLLAEIRTALAARPGNSTSPASPHSGIGLRKVRVL